MLQRAPPTRWAQDVVAEGTEGARLAARAVELGKDDGNVLSLSAYAAWNLGMDTPRATELASRSLVVNPNCAMALTLLGWIEACMGGRRKDWNYFGVRSA